MLREICDGHRWRIALTYVVFSCEFTLFALLPMLLGKAVDSLLAQQHTMFLAYIGLSLVGALLGFFRRRLDTRVFSRIWSEFATKAVMKLMDRGVERTRIVSRAGFVVHYSDFLEYTLPTILSSVFNIVISLILIISAAPNAGLPVLLLTFLTLAACYKFSCRIKDIESRAQDAREANHTAIVNGDRDTVATTYERMRMAWINRSDTDAASWGIQDMMLLASQILVVLAVAQQGHTVGTIMATLTYTTRIFERVDILGMGITSWKQVELANSLLAGEDVAETFDEA